MAGLATRTDDAIQSLRIHPDGKPAFIAEDELRRRVAEAAYYLAERRGFEPGHDVDDWLEAEQQVKDELTLAAL